MQRLDRKRHTGLSRKGQQLCDAVAHLSARTGELARARRQAAGDENQALRAEHVRFGERAAIVVQRRAPSRLVGCGEHAAATQPRDRHAVSANRARRSFQSHLLQLVAPGSNAPDAMTRTAVDGLRERPTFANSRSVEREKFRAGIRSHSIASVSAGALSLSLPRFAREAMLADLP